MTDIEVQFKDGGSFVAYRPQFSQTGETVYVACKNCIRSYSTKTGSPLVNFTGPKSAIVGFLVHYQDSYECITACSETGEVVTWKAVTQFKLLKKKIGQRHIKSFHLVNTQEMTALISYREDDEVRLELVNLVSNDRTLYNLTLSSGDKYCIDVSTNGHFVVAQGTNVYFMRVNNFKKILSSTLKWRTFTCLACHPEEEAVLTGDSTGRVVLWRNILSLKRTQVVYHWHTLPVKCVAFSTVGSHFYSGGDESVLVQWQVDNNLEKRFLPRLLSSLKQITVSPNNLFIAISTGDNAVKIVDPRFDSVSTIQHLVIGDHLNSGIVVDPRTKALVLNGNVGHLQFYDQDRGSLLYNVDVVGQNKITNERTCKMECTQVRKVAVSKSGLWLATVEDRRDPEYSPEIRVKFWAFDQEIQRYWLNTSIESPHEKGINSILFQPTNNDNDLKCVTVGDDKKFKIWQLLDSTDIYRKGVVWKCICNGFYREFSCNALSFSSDGSLIAVNFNEILTTWQPDTCDLKCSLVHPIYKEHITHVQFGIGSQCHLLVAASNGRMSVWNLLNLAMVWTVPLRVTHLVASPVTMHMAAVTKDKKLFVFCPSSPEPEFTLSLMKQGKIEAIAFVPGKYSSDVRLSWYQRTPIFFINHKRELFSLGSGEESTPVLYNDELETSLFSRMQPEVKSSSAEAMEQVKHLFAKDSTQKSLKKYLEAPLHTMVPVRLMCGSILRSMVLQKT